MSYIFVKNAPITLYRSRETHLWPVGPIYGQSDPNKFCRALRAAVFITHFAKKLSGRENIQRFGVVVLPRLIFFPKNITRQYLAH